MRSSVELTQIGLVHQQDERALLTSSKLGPELGQCIC